MHNGIVVSAVRAARLIDQGCTSFWCYAIQSEEPSRPEMTDVPIVRDFLAVFPADLLGAPPPRDVDFSIELEPGMRPISRPHTGGRRQSWQS